MITHIQHTFKCKNKMFIMHIQHTFKMLFFLFEFDPIIRKISVKWAIICVSLTL